MKFQNHRIRKDTPPPVAPVRPTKSFDQKGKTRMAMIGGGITLILVIIFAMYSLVNSLDLSSIIFSFGKNLQVDEYGHTNILLVGVGGEGHDGPDLTDSIIVASIDYDNKVVPMLSIPRDLYIKSKKLHTAERINSIYSVGKNKFSSKEGLQELQNIVSAMIGMPINYFIKVDFKGFKKIVDNLEGIDIIVEKEIYDTQYPRGETIEYETFALPAGPQHLNGETALKYARSRHGKGNESADFDRARRQQQLLSALKEKALSLNVLTDPFKIKALYESINSSIETDLSVTEIIELAKIAKDLGKESIISRLINDNPQACGGYLYTPPRENYSGASVLLPAGNNYDLIHQFAKNLFRNALLAQDQSGIQILNGTRMPNIAGEVMAYFNRLCYNIVHYGNASNRDIAESTLYYEPGPNGEKPKIVDFITSVLKIKTQAGIPGDYLNTEKKYGTKVVVELGKDYLEKRIKDPYL